MAELHRPMDCGDSRCEFAVELSGVRTRATCQCMRHLLPELSVERQGEVRDVIRATIAAHVAYAISGVE